MDYDNTDSGALFKNDKKETEKHPDYRGSINVGGTDYWLSAWIKTAKTGGKYMSLAVTAKDAPRDKAAPVVQRLPEDPFADQDIPF